MYAANRSAARRVNLSTGSGYPANQLSLTWRYSELMTAKERLHRLIDALSDQEAEVALMLIEQRRAAGDEPSES